METKENMLLKRNRESVKKYVDKATAFIYADEECLILSGNGGKIMETWGLLTMKLVDLAGKGMVKDTFKIAMDCCEEKKEDLDIEIKAIKKDLLNKVKEMLERE